MVRIIVVVTAIRRFALLQSSSRPGLYLHWIWEILPVLVVLFGHNCMLVCVNYSAAAEDLKLPLYLSVVVYTCKPSCWPFHEASFCTQRQECEIKLLGMFSSPLKISFQGTYWAQCTENLTLANLLIWNKMRWTEYARHLSLVDVPLRAIRVGFFVMSLNTLILGIIISLCVFYRTDIIFVLLCFFSLHRIWPWTYVDYVLWHCTCRVYALLRCAGRIKFFWIAAS